MNQELLTNDFTHQYNQRLKQKTLRVGVPSAIIGVIGSAGFYYLDQVDLELAGTLFWRGLGMFGGLIFIIGWLFKPLRSYVIPLHAFSLLCYLLMMSGIGYIIFSDPAVSQKHYFAITAGFLSVWFVISLIAQGARQILIYTGIVLIIGITILYVMMSPSTIDNVGYIFSIFLVGVFAVWRMYNQAHYEYDQALSLFKLEQSKEQISQQAIDLQNKNDNLLVFSRAMSHDLQGPLRRVYSFIDLYELLSRDRLPEDTQEYLDLARKHLRKGQKVIDDLLIYAKIGQDELRKQEVDMDQLCNIIIEEQLILQSTHESDVVVTRQIEKNVCGDEKLLWYLLTNLISNAIKFSSKQECPKVVISCQAIDREVVLSVADNGVGFDENFAQELGRPFKRFHGAEYTGTGIGLSIVSQIVKMHEGRFWAESPPGTGATFYCAFPA